MEIYSKDFGQHEELVTRIKRILSGYPCDVGVLKELLQNADDAKASEVHIVVDFSERIYNEGPLHKEVLQFQHLLHE
jgi:hypothetical protein